MKYPAFFIAMTTVLLAATAHANDKEYCREFTKTIYVGGRAQQGYGVSCRQPDGSWHITREASTHRYPSAWVDDDHPRPLSKRERQRQFALNQHHRAHAQHVSRHACQHPGRGHHYGWHKPRYYTPAYHGWHTGYAPYSQLSISYESQRSDRFNHYY